MAVLLKEEDEVNRTSSEGRSQTCLDYAESCWRKAKPNAHEDELFVQIFFGAFVKSVYLCAKITTQTLYVSFSLNVWMSLLL